MRPLVLLSLAATLLAQTGASNHAARASGGGATIGATIISPQEAKKRFGVDLQKLGYTAVEIGVEPERSVELAARDFVLRLPRDGRTVRAVSPRAIGGKTGSKPPKIPERVQVHTTGTVGYETGPYGRGTYGGAGVGVGIGDRTAPAAPPRSPDVDTVELERLALPEGRFDKPVSGYLYFPVTLKKSAVEITWYAADGQVRLAMVPTK